MICLRPENGSDAPRDCQVLIIAQLGMGTGIKWMTDEELKSSWREHDHRLTDHWQRNYDDELFVASIARMEG